MTRSGAAPEHTDEVTRANTGRGWDDWVALIDGWDGRADGRAASRTKMTDGTFTANRSATVAVWKTYWGERLDRLREP